MFDWYFRYVEPKIGTEDFDWKRWHHGYAGVLLLTIGFILIFPMSIDSFLCDLILFFGFWCLMDDIIQHKLQKAEIEERGYYTIRTFLNWVFYPKYW